MTIQAVKQALAKSPPGLEAQLGMVPPYRRQEAAMLRSPPSCKQAGVLLLLYPVHDRLHFPLTRRPEIVEFHKGQISLPGGAQEAGESLQQTALRETQEEIGVPADEIEVIGRLTPLFVPPSNFSIQPWVGWRTRRPQFKIEPTEVAELIEAPLDVLLDPATAQVEEWELRGGKWAIPHYRFGSHKVWGATAMILCEFVAMMKGENSRGLN
jgi:8-oxo-dGTP pyrophosphatase MutT (NUDIX family)